MLIPTYNRAKYFEECLNSVLTQDYPNLEIIVSDNASTDNTTEVVKKYLSDKRVRYYRNEVNVGIIANWKKLLYEYATGEYGKLICDDDYLLDKEHIRKSIDLILSKKVDVVVCGGVQIVEGFSGLPEKISYDYEIPEITDANWWLENGGKKINGIYLFLNFNDGAVFSIKKAKELKAFIPDSFGLDYEILLRFILSGRIGYIGGHHFVARSHPANDGRLESFEKAFAGTEMFSRIYEYGLSLGLPEKKLLKLKRRNLIVFSVVFLVDKWFSSKGVSLTSIYNFYRRMSNLDKIIFFSVITNYATVSTLLRRKNVKIYEFLRRIIKK
ncbi:MAG: glycosyltransferase [Elusimicrobiota bacterium]|nr:glycosyltransferase [Elusimicrobiota bacterium]